MNDEMKDLLSAMLRRRLLALGSKDKLLTEIADVLIQHVREGEEATDDASERHVYAQWCEEMERSLGGGESVDG